MMFTIGKADVIGNKKNDNKDPKNRQKATSSSMMGTIGKSAGNTKLSPQNSSNQTPPGPDQTGDKGVKMQAKRQKKIIRKDTLYTDQAMAAAKKMKK